VYYMGVMKNLPFPLKGLPGKAPVYIDNCHWVVTARQAAILAGGKAPKLGYEKRIVCKGTPLSAIDGAMPASLTVDMTLDGASRLEVYTVGRTSVSCRTDMEPGDYPCVRFWWCP